jgi:tetratricopeptide (TPR) repeat protein
MDAGELGRHEEAIDGFRAVLAANPRMLMIWPMLARSLHETGRLPEALEAYERSLAASEDSPRVALSAARVAYRLGDPAKAQRYAELAAPAFPVAYRMIAQLALASGELGKAESAALAAVEGNPADPSALMLVAQVRLGQGRLDDALAAVDRAEAQAESQTSQPILQGLDLVRGNILARAGRAAEAAAAYEREIARYPADPRAYVQQVFLRAESGDAEAIVPLLQRMIDGNGTDGGWIAAVRALRALGDLATAETLLAEGRRRFPDSAGLRTLREEDGG